MKVKDEPNEFDDALRTLASAAVAHDSMSLAEQQLQNEPVPDSLRQKQIPTSTELQLPLSMPAIKREIESIEPYIHSNGPAPPRLTRISDTESRWFDVDIVRTTSCIIRNFYFTETSIDHSTDTSDYIPDYSGIRKLALLPGTAYKFRVAAVNSCGIGEWSDVSAFKTCLPGYPGAPCQIRITKSNEGANLKWDPPVLRYGKITEYSVCLAIKNEASQDGSTNGNVLLRNLPFVRVYCGVENCALVENSSLKAAYIDRGVKPAIIFRIAARNEKGYGPATQVRWLQDYPGAQSNSKETNIRSFS